MGAVIPINQSTSQPSKCMPPPLHHSVWSWPWPLTSDLDNFFSTATHRINVCAKFREIGLVLANNWRTTAERTDGRAAGRTTEKHNAFAANFSMTDPLVPGLNRTEPAWHYKNHVIIYDSHFTFSWHVWFESSKPSIWSRSTYIGLYKPQTSARSSVRITLLMSR